MIIFVLGAMIYGIVAGIPHEYLYLGLSMMIAGMSIGYGNHKN